MVALIAALAGPAAAESRESVTIAVEGGSLTGVLFAPEKTPAPAVLVLHTAYGKAEAADERFAGPRSKRAALPGFLPQVGGPIEGSLESHARAHVYSLQAELGVERLYWAGAGAPRSNPSVLRSSSMSGQ